MLRLIATLLLVVAGAAAAEERKFAVLSLISDQMLVTQYVPTIGGRIDRNPREYLQLDDPVLDKTALFTVSEVLTRIDPAAKPVLLVGLCWLEPARPISSCSRSCARRRACGSTTTSWAAG